MSHIPWLVQAESDLDAARVLSAEGFHSQAVWLAAQAVEKGHKAIVAALGLRYEDKHYKQLGHGIGEIATMLPAALHEPADAGVASIVSQLENRALTCRYPGLKPTLAGGRVQLAAPATSFSSSAEDVEDAATLLDWCRKRIERAVKAAFAMKP
jgi:HEPN domain-containing protein